MKTWAAEYSKGINVKQIDKGCSFELSGNAEIHYLTRKYGAPKLPPKLISVTVQIEGGPFTAIEPGTPVISVYLQQKGDDMTSDGFRWWSNPGHIKVDRGTYTLRVPLRPNQFQGLWGKMANVNAAYAQRFLQALKKLQTVGITFGGGGGGHGVKASKPSKITVVAFAYEP